MRLGVDYQGAARLYLYRSPRDKKYWAISNSLQLLIKNLHERKRPMNLLKDVFTSWSGHGEFLQQMTSFESFVKEISLLPRWLDLELTPSRDGKSCQIGLVRCPTYRLKENVSYEAALRDYLVSWHKRIPSLLMHTRAAQVDLSGGLDSRTVFSLFKPFLDAGTFKDRLVVFSVKPEQAPKDFQIARTITTDLGFDLSCDYVTASRSTLPSLDETFSRWENNRLGQYHLGAFLTTSSIIGEDRMRFVGVGGEQYRPFFNEWSRDLDCCLDVRRKFFPKPKKLGTFKSRLAKMTGSNKDLFEQFAKRVNASADMISRENDLLGQDRMTLHYREFRNRFHFGVPATETMTFAPLSGVLMDQLAGSAPSDYLKNKQIFYDVMANSCPQLLEAPFDRDDKVPTSENLDRITTLSNLTSPSLPREALEQVDTFQETQERGVPQDRLMQNAQDIMEEMLRRVMDSRKHCPDSIRFDHEKERNMIKDAIPNGRLVDGKAMRYFHFISLCHTAKTFGIS